ncbi:PREDICTED: thaumatin-like protein 1 [Camelina sativa]|uniref:Thaumatin-like protein 1 n=1 Tax=Camelina sativa TaxID=90675 RepID=A0ABM0WWN2_CAMSA|nr:PREDICTED: thaumatin-like protein 1 [Camelina sativa]
MALIFFFFFLLSNLFFSGAMSRSFTIANKCDYTVWPGILSNAGVPPLPTTGFVLQKGETRTIDAPSSWGGRFWGRTLCSTGSDGRFTCATGDCGSGKLECSGTGAAPPATLAEFTLDGSGGLDFYDVSLVDGYNVQMLVAPQGGSGLNCSTTGCVVDLNGSCPSELRVNSVGGGDKGGTVAMACKSACEAFREPEYCCSGAFGSPDTCKPSSYSRVFKSACPRAYSYAYDDKSSTFTCAKSPNYVITFCPSPNTSLKSAEEHSTETMTTTSSSSSGSKTSSSESQSQSQMVYEGALDESSGSPPSTCHGVSRVITVALSFAFCRMWWFF